VKYSEYQLYLGLIISVSRMGIEEILHCELQFDIELQPTYVLGSMEVVDVFS